MIPKIIHYCWFGGNPLPGSVKKYIATWQKYCPDYEIKEWNESNFDINANKYCKEAYQAKKWAFVSDYVRLQVLCEYGGIYMDTDVELCKPFDDLLKYNGFCGFESILYISTATLATTRDNEWISMLLHTYDKDSFIKEDGTYNLTTNVVRITEFMKNKYPINFNDSFQIFGDNNAVFPFEYFCAKNYKTGEISRTKKTYTIHNFSGSWLNKKQRLRNSVKEFFRKVLGINIVRSIYKFLKNR